MKLEAGKWYRTRDGQKAFVGFQHPISKCWVGYIEGEPLQRVWSPDGKWNSPNEYCLDLIAEWIDAPKVGSMEWANSLPEGTKVKKSTWMDGTPWAYRKGDMWYFWSLTRACLEPLGPVSSVKGDGWSLYVEPPAVGSSAWANSLPVGSKVRWRTWAKGDYATRTASGWETSNITLGSPHQYGDDNEGWLLYTEPKLRQWKLEEVPFSARFRIIGHEWWSFLSGVNTDGNPVIAMTNEPETASNLLRGWEHSTDNGVTWKPCGIES